MKRPGKTPFAVSLLALIFIFFTIGRSAAMSITDVRNPWPIGSAAAQVELAGVPQLEILCQIRVKQNDTFEGHSGIEEHVHSG